MFGSIKEVFVLWVLSLFPVWLVVYTVLPILVCHLVFISHLQALSGCICSRHDVQLFWLGCMRCFNSNDIVRELLGFVSSLSQFLGSLHMHRD